MAAGMFSATRLRAGKTGGKTSQVLAIISILLLVLGLIVVCLYAAATPGRPLRFVAVGILTALAALVTGCLFGFLFGIPKLVSTGELRLRKDTGATAEVITTTRDTQTQAAVISTGTKTTRPEEAPAAGAAANSEVPSAGNTPIQQSGTLPGQSPFEPSTNLSEVSDWLTKLLLGAGLVELTHLGKPLGNLIHTVAVGLGQQNSPDNSSTTMAGALLITYFVLGFLDGYVVTTLWYGRRISES